jgi:hypothetical protein
MLLHNTSSSLQALQRHQLNQRQGHQTSDFPKILGQFTQFLMTHRSSKAVSILQAYIQAHAENISNSNKLLDGFANLDPTMLFDALFALTLRKFG